MSVQLVRLDDRDPGITYSSGWSLDGHTGEYLETVTRANTLGSNMTVLFTGTKIRVFGTIPPSIFGEAPHSIFSVDCSVGLRYIQAQSTNTTYQQEFFESAELANGPHVLTVAIIDVPSANASLIFDYAEYDSSDAPVSFPVPSSPSADSAEPTVQATPFAKDTNFPFTSTLARSLTSLDTDPFQDATTAAPTSSSAIQTTDSTILLTGVTSSDSSTSSSTFSSFIGSTTSSLISYSTSSSSNTKGNEPQDRNLLPIVFGAVIVALVIFFFLIGVFLSLRKKNRAYNMFNDEASRPIPTGRGNIIPFTGRSRPRPATALPLERSRHYFHANMHPIGLTASRTPVAESMTRAPYNQLLTTPSVDSTMFDKYEEIRLDGAAGALAPPPYYSWHEMKCRNA